MFVMPAQHTILMLIVAIGTDDILQAGGKVGTASNQWLLGCLVVVLIIIVLYRERQQNKQSAAAIIAHQEASKKAEASIDAANDKHREMMDAFSKERRDLLERAERVNAEMNEERRQRWTMMIDVIRENTIAFRGLRETMDNVQRVMSDNKRTELIK